MRAINSTPSSVPTTPPRPAGQAGATQDGGGDDVEFATDQRAGRHRLQKLGLRQTAAIPDTSPR